MRPACRPDTVARPAHVSACACALPLQLSGSCGVLRILYLRGCHAIRDDICKQLSQVEELDLAFTSVTGAADPGL